MTLLDFFTLTEMRDGLSNLTRVDELLSMIQNLEDCVTNNVGDAVRQWSTVASTLAATDNEECLNHFVQLNGIFFLNKWLQEAQTFSADASNNVVEELISALLASLERLPINSNSSTASEIAVTVKYLLDHRSLEIKEKARILCDKWNHATQDNVSCHDEEIGGTCQSDQARPSEDTQLTENSVDGHPVLDIPLYKQGTSEVESPRIESDYPNITRCLESPLPDSTNMGKVSIVNQNLISSSSNSVIEDTGLVDKNTSRSSLASNRYQDNLSVMEEYSVGAVFASTSICNPQCRFEGDADHHDVSLLENASDSAKEMEMNRMEGKPSKSSQKEICSSSSFVALSVSEASQLDLTEPTISCLLDSKNTKFSASKTTESQPTIGVVDCGPKISLTTTNESNLVALVTKGSQDFYGSASFASTINGTQSSCQREAMRSDSGIKDLSCETDLKVHERNVVIFPDSSKVVETKASEGISEESELGILCGDDTLQVARQVATAVEHEVVDYREPFFSFLEVNSTEMTGTHSLDSEGRKVQEVIQDVGGNSSSAKDHFGSSSSTNEGSEITEIVSSNLEKFEEDIESPNLNSGAEESDGKSDRERCVIDLNVDFCSEDLECVMKPMPDMLVDVSAPIANVASSKEAPLSPVVPLHFEGELGWKDSVATSASQPSPQRTTNVEKEFSGPKQKSNSLEIDLNVARNEDELVVESILLKHLPASSILPLEDSSTEFNAKAKKLKLDLNRLGDEDALTYPSSYWRPHDQNREQSLSFASSSSRQPSFRGFDLNYNPSLLDVGSSHNFDKSSSEVHDTGGRTKLDDPVIMIMGSRMLVDRKDFASQAQHHMQPLGYDYVGPMGPMMSIPQVIYSPGSIPFMVDPRGATVLPQASGLCGFTGAPSAWPPSSSSGFASLQPSLDLNFEMKLMENRVKEGGDFKQFLL